MKEEDIRLENIADTDNEIFALLKQRYSPRVFKNKTIDEAKIKQLFEAVRWSASSNNIQPWRFIYAQKGSEAYESIFCCLSDFNRKWANNAPILVLAIYKKENSKGQENFHALHDLGLGLGAMTVQAQYMGIGLHHMAGVDWQKAHKIFNIPEGFHVSTAIGIGYYGGNLDDLSEDLKAEETDKRKRIAIDQFAFKDTWSNLKNKNFE